MINESQKKRYRFWFDTELRGLPVKIAVKTFTRLSPFNGSPHFCDSDLDFFGGIYASFDIISKKMKLAPFQQNDLNFFEESDVLAEIYEIMDSKKYDYEPTD